MACHKPICYPPSHIILTPGRPVLFCGSYFMLRGMQAGTSSFFKAFGMTLVDPAPTGNRIHKISCSVLDPQFKKKGRGDIPGFSLYSLGFSELEILTSGPEKHNYLIKMPFLLGVGKRPARCRETSWYVLSMLSMLSSSMALVISSFPFSYDKKVGLFSAIFLWFLVFMHTPHVSKPMFYWHLPCTSPRNIYTFQILNSKPPNESFRYIFNAKYNN